MKFSRQLHKIAGSGAVLVLALGLATASSQASIGDDPTASAASGASRGTEPVAKNMKLLGMDDLDGRSTYSSVVQQQGDRWILYAGHQSGSGLNTKTGTEEPNGTSIVDVTDPTNPQYLRHVPGPADRAGAEHTRICLGDDLPSGRAGQVYMLRSFGKTAHEMWNVTDPAKPHKITTVVDGLRGTHKNWWDCETGTGYLVGGPPGWRSSQILQVFDLSDPEHPRHIRDFGLPGMEPGSTAEIPTGELGPARLHGPIVAGDRVYMAWGFTEVGVIQILDRDKLINGSPEAADPFAPTTENLQYPEVGSVRMPDNLGAHTTFPVLDVKVEDLTPFAEGAERDFLLVVSEEIWDECIASPHMSFMVDITDEAHPFPVSTLATPASAGNYCEVGGRFGPHASNESFNAQYYGKLVFISYFNAGVRVFDIRDPFAPREVGHYVPAVTENTMPSCLDGECKTAVQTNNVDLDGRGYVYIVDRMGTGLHILDVVGQARAIANEGT